MCDVVESAPTKTDLPMLMEVLRGQVLGHSMDAHGCRLVQRALALADDAGRVEIAQELRGHICEVLESPHGNYVLQRIIELMRPSVVSFVLGELTACMTPQELAKHRYGCRILERIIEHFPPRLLATSVDALLADAWDLCRHVYGKFRDPTPARAWPAGAPKVHRRRLV